MIRERVGFKTLLAVSGLILQTGGRKFKNEEVHEIGQQRDLPVRGAGYEPSTTRSQKSQMISQRPRLGSVFLPT